MFNLITDHSLKPVVHALNLRLMNLICVVFIFKTCVILKTKTKTIKLTTYKFSNYLSVLDLQICLKYLGIIISAATNMFVHFIVLLIKFIE